MELIDLTTGAILGTLSPSPSRIVLDPVGGKTYALSTTQLSRLDNDTASPTPIANGSAWFDGAVLKDQCPDTAVIIASIFTTQGGSGTLTIAAPGSCSWTIDASTAPGLSFNSQSGSGAATIPFTIAATSAPAIHTFGRFPRTARRRASSASARPRHGRISPPSSGRNSPSPDSCSRVHHCRQAATRSPSSRTPPSPPRFRCCES